RAEKPDLLPEPQVDIQHVAGDVLDDDVLHPQAARGGREGEERTLDDVQRIVEVWSWSSHGGLDLDAVLDGLVMHAHGCRLRMARREAHVAGDLDRTVIVNDRQGRAVIPDGHVALDVAHAAVGWLGRLAVRI